MQKKIRVLLGGSLLALVAAQAQAANYATCLLDKLPGTQNDVAAQANMQVCLGKYPGGIEAIIQGQGRGLLGFNSGAECTAKKAGDTRSNRAAVLIGVACRKLYDEPVKLIPFSGKLDGEK
ncbi:hypothetical protein [Comamonas sp. 26]|uniref:hypothetical protein n=1 Tax=Comamonas sp. 26 TaxID=2035201 RepID=UPI000C6ACA0C|nr:hypothetical protein [Comamonas sp. 26]PIG09614.1 hypothetical protein CLU84_2544 [Comamonas sp. 26]